MCVQLLLPFRTKKVDQTFVAPKLGSEVEESFSIAVDGFIKPVHHGSADAWMRVHVLSWNTGLAITHCPLPPYPMDGYLEADTFGDMAGVLDGVAYAGGELALHLALFLPALVGYGGLLLALGELQAVALGGVAHHGSPADSLLVELLAGDGFAVYGCGD